MLTELYSQLDFLKYGVKNSSPPVISAVSGCSVFLEQKLNHLLKCVAYCFAVLSNQDFIISYRAHWIIWTACQSFSDTRHIIRSRFLKKGCFRSGSFGWCFGRYKLSALGGMINAFVNNNSCEKVNHNWLGQFRKINIPVALSEMKFL